VASYLDRVVAATQQAWRSLKARTLTFVGNQPQWRTVRLGRTRYSYAGAVGDGRGNAALMAVVLWVCRTFPEAPMLVQIRRRSGDIEPLPDHALTQLIDTPNPHYPGELLWWATLADWMLTGNAYWLKIRSGAGRVVELWWLPAATVTPKRPDDGSQFVSYYEYVPTGTVNVRYAPSEIVHFRYGLNPADGGLTGSSPVAALLREVFTDDEAANYSASLLRNLGVPGVIVSPAIEGGATTDDLRASKQAFMSAFGGDNQGEPLFMSGPTKVEVLSFNPEQLQLTSLRRIPEERISAIFGVAAVVVGLGAGLDRSTYNNYKEAREAAYESNVIPTQRLLAAQLRSQLLPEFGDPMRLSIGFDLAAVRVLQTDENELAIRVDTQLRGGAITLDEARAMLGKPPVEGGHGNVFYVPTRNTVTPADELDAPPEPMPAPLALPPGEAPDEAEQDEDEDVQAAARRHQDANGHKAPALVGGRMN
jgi:HK97 family phage portal protein